MEKGRTILSNARFALTIDRLCHQLIEEYDNFEDVCMIGVQERGVLLANRIYDRLTNALAVNAFEYGKLDISFYRDDFRMREKPLKVSATEIDFLVEDKRVILIDDVLFSGRTIQAALSALNHYGRPKSIELLVLVDRRFQREIPINPDYTGLTVDALDNAYVRVKWAELNGKDEIFLTSNQ